MVSQNKNLFFFFLNFYFEIDFETRFETAFGMVSILFRSLFLRIPEFMEGGNVDE
jgi:hypothetical protein